MIRLDEITPADLNEVDGWEQPEDWDYDPGLEHYITSTRETARNEAVNLRAPCSTDPTDPTEPCLAPSI